jgi:hypothetical protein
MNPIDELRAAASRLWTLVAADGIEPAPWRSEWHEQQYELRSADPTTYPIAEWTFAINTVEPKASVERAECDTANADYIAAMHPGVGAALAEFLDVEADVADEIRRQSPDLTDDQLAANVHGALTIARALNGGEKS